MKRWMLVFAVLFVVAGGLSLPPDLGCHRLTGHDHGHGKPITVCVGA